MTLSLSSVCIYNSLSPFLVLAGSSHLIIWNQMSTQLFLNLLLINKSTFISEDLAFLTSFYSLQKDLPQDKGLKSKVWLLLTITILSSLIASVYFGYGLSILTSGLCLPYILFTLYSLLYLRFCEYQVKGGFNTLSTCLRDNHKLLKKLLVLGQELEIIERNCTSIDSNSSKIVKSTFEIAVRMFDVLRDETKTALSLPATTEDVNREDKYISCLPNQLFEDLLCEENPTPRQLKNLMQLIRIQQSEFLRRILCVHVSGTVEEKSKILCRIISSLTRCHDKMEPEHLRLESLFAYHQAYCFEQNQTPTSSQRTLSDVDHLMKSIRLHLHAALLLLNNIEKVASRDSVKSHYCISDDLLKIETELALGSDNLKTLSKKYRKNEDEYPCKQVDPAKLAPARETRTVIVDENFQPTIEDQVFELFIDDDDCLDLQCSDEVEVSAAMFDDFPSISSNLFQELKTVLIPKAEETRAREAKALGIPKEKVPIQLNNDYGVKTNENLKRPRSMRKEAETTNLMSNNFTSALATKAAQISKDLKLNLREECFGDSDHNDCDLIVG